MGSFVLSFQNAPGAELIATVGSSRSTNTHLLSPLAEMFHLVLRNVVLHICPMWSMVATSSGVTRVILTDLQ